MIFCLFLVFSAILFQFVGSDSGLWVWWVFGIACYFWYRFQALENKVRALQEQIKSRAATLSPQADPVPFSAPPPPTSIPTPTRADEIAPTPTAPPPVIPSRPAPAPAIESPSITGGPPKAVRPQTPVTYQPSVFETFVQNTFTTAKDWLLGGNTVVRVGLVVFFMGLAWLLRYASERYELPVEARYIGASVAGVLLLALGWRLRLKKPGYALMLQGGGIAVLYLTAFAAMRLHALLPPEGAFAVMILLTAAAVLLAIVQDAMALACAAILGGLASPILVSTGSGNHVILFSYLALLNTGIALIAWFKAWRVLNLIGFVGTFGIGIAWGLRSYTPERFATTEPFLILFLLMFILIGSLFARRKLLAQKDETFPISPWSEANTDYLDGTLAFGPPVLGFGLQCAIIAHIEYGMAFSALALGVLYFALAFCLRGRAEIRLMAEVYLALGVVFGTLAIPLAFDAEWTSAAWALEGAGIYWIGQIQRRPLARGFALLLIVAASFAYLGDVSIELPPSDPFLLGSPIGAALLGVAYLSCYFVRRRKLGETVKTGEQPLDFALGIAGLAFLYLVMPCIFARYDMMIAWALAGMVTVFAGTWLLSRAFIVSAFVIQLIGGLLLLALADSLLAPLFGNVYHYLPLGELYVASGLAFAGFVSAWRLHHAASRTVDLDAIFSLDPGWFKDFSNLFLIWGIGWWGWYVVMSNAIVFPDHGGLGWYKTLHAILLLLSFSSALWMALAYFAKWRSLALACLLPIPVATLVLAKHGVILHEDAAITWGVFFLTHLAVLRVLSGLLPETVQRVAHVVGVWLGILALTLATTATCNRFMPDQWDSEWSYWFSNPRVTPLFRWPDQWDGAWYWLAWALAPGGYLALTLFERLRFWPVSAFAREYRFHAALPVMTLLMVWFWSANLIATGNSDPLPYIPLLNPLELGLLLVLFVCWRWCLRWASEAGTPWRKTCRNGIALIGGVSVFAVATQTVCRIAHAWMEVPFDFYSMTRSMGVQASWSIEWTLMALVLMVCGSFRKNRGFWLAGAALIAVVVLKLFLVELRDYGGLARIISFIGVGLLLLVVGYFAPIPPKKNPASLADVNG